MKSSIFSSNETGSVRLIDKFVDNCMKFSWCHTHYLVGESLPPKVSELFWSREQRHPVSVSAKHCYFKQN